MRLQVFKNHAFLKVQALLHLRIASNVMQRSDILMILSYFILLHIWHFYISGQALMWCKKGNYPISNTYCTKIQNILIIEYESSMEHFEQ